MDLIFDPDFQLDVMARCYELALNSPDPSTQNGAVLVDDAGMFKYSEAWNEFPRGSEYTDERWERPLKYRYIEHAERNSIYFAARHGLSTDGMGMVCPWAACSDCARAIIQAGITVLVVHKQAHDRVRNDHWAGEIAIAQGMFVDAGVQMIFLDADIGSVKPVLHDGKLWTP